MLPAATTSAVAAAATAAARRRRRRARHRRRFGFGRAGRIVRERNLFARGRSVWSPFRAGHRGVLRGFRGTAPRTVANRRDRRGIDRRGGDRRGIDRRGGDRRGIDRRGIDRGPPSRRDDDRATGPSTGTSIDPTATGTDGTIGIAAAAAAVSATFGGTRRWRRFGARRTFPGRRRRTPRRSRRRRRPRPRPRRSTSFRFLVLLLLLILLVLLVLLVLLRPTLDDVVAYDVTRTPSHVESIDSVVALVRLELSGVIPLPV